jgi:hypothetical protein
MKNKTEDTKPDIAAQSIYPALARASLFDLHENELELLDKGLSKIKGPRNVVIVGPGSEVVPFSENLETVINMLNGGNLILMDYNGDICNKIPAYLTEKGFNEKFDIKKIKGEFDPRKSSNTIFIQDRNILDGYSVPDNSISAIDMTVSVHHATQYEEDIATICNEAKRALQPGGILHIGEGDVDMKYSERKINKIVQDIFDSGTKTVKTSDKRYQDLEPRFNMFCRTRHPGKYDRADVFISRRGAVEIIATNPSKLYRHLEETGYKQIHKTVHKTEKNIILPLIDHAIEEDFQGMIVPVRAYYQAIKDTCLPRLDKKHHDAFAKALSKEQSDAERGLVEFYSPPSMICNNMRKTGLSIDERRYTKHGPFVNISAIKN